MSNLRKKIDNMSNSELDEFIKKLAYDQFLFFNEEEVQKYKNDFLKTTAKFDIFDEINTDNIEQLNYPISNNNFYLRSDEEIIELDGRQWVETEPHNNENYIEIKYAK